MSTVTYIYRSLEEMAERFDYLASVERQKANTSPTVRGQREHRAASIAWECAAYHVRASVIDPGTSTQPPIGEPIQTPHRRLRLGAQHATPKNDDRTAPDTERGDSTDPKGDGSGPACQPACPVVSHGELPVLSPEPEPDDG